MNIKRFLIDSWIKQVALLCTLFIFICSNLYAYDEQQAEEYYAKGVIEFEQNHLQKALDAFIKCDSLRCKDEDFVGITSNTEHWKAYIMYSMRMFEQARDASLYYGIQPIDLRKLGSLISREKAAITCKLHKDYSTSFDLYLLCVIEAIAKIGEGSYIVGNYFYDLANIAKFLDGEKADAHMIKPNVMNHYQKCLNIFSGYGEKSHDLCQVVNLERACWVAGDPSFDISTLNLPPVEDVILPQKGTWYGIEFLEALERGDDDEAIKLYNEFRMLEKIIPSDNYNAWYELLTNTYIDILEKRKELPEAVKQSAALCDFLKQTKGVDDSRYKEAILRQGDLLRSSDRIFEELALYADNVSIILDFHNVLSSVKENPDEEHPEIAITVDFIKRLLNLMKVTGNNNDLESKDMFESISELLNTMDWRKYVDKPDFNYLLKLYELSQNELADYYNKHGDREMAIAIYEELIADSLIVQYGSYYQWKANCSLLYYHTNPQKALEYLEDAESNLADNDGTLLENLMVLYAQIYPDSPRVAELDSVAFEKHHNKIISSLISLSNEDRESLWSNMYKYRNDGFCIFSKMCNGENEKVNAIAYNSLLLGRGFLLAAQTDMQRAISNSQDVQIMVTNLMIKNLSAELDTMMSDAPDYWTYFSAISRLKSELAAKLVETEGFKSRYDITYEDVKKYLSDKSVAVEFCYSKCGLQEDGYDFYAYILRKDWNYPKAVRLDLPADLKDMPDLYINPKWTSVVWDRILSEGKIQRGDTVFFAADGDIHAIGIENMLYKKTRKPISMSYNILRLSSTRELCFDDKDDAKEVTMVLYGGLDYSDITTTARAAMQRGSSQGLTPLPQTKVEIESIYQTLSDSIDISSVKLYTGIYGTEESFSAMSGKSPFILHVATHGDYLKMNGSSMNRSVLYLSGAEKAYFGESEVPHEKNGILTASEICDMDLSSTDMVVMSACNSGLGYIGADGVFGLQRGFKMSGVQSILMSLWPVDDAATCKLMTEFYSNLIAKKMTKYEALEAAKKTIRETPGWDAPEYWAAFILLDGLD